MNVNDLDNQINLSREMLQKAQTVCAKLHSSVNEQLLKTDVSDGFFKDPQSAILEEDVIKSAPPHFIALAAFISQAVEGMQNAILLLDAKIDAVSAAMNESMGYMKKANDSTLDLVKAVTSEVPVSQFSAAQPLTREQIAKANQRKTGLENFSRQQISNALFNLVQDHKAEIKDITKFEQSGNIAPGLVPLVLEEIKKTKA